MGTKKEIEECDKENTGKAVFNFIKTDDGMEIEATIDITGDMISTMIAHVLDQVREEEGDEAALGVLQTSIHLYTHQHGGAD